MSQQVLASPSLGSLSPYAYQQSSAGCITPQPSCVTPVVTPVITPAPTTTTITNCTQPAPPPPVCTTTTCQTVPVTTCTTTVPTAGCGTGLYGGGYRWAGMLLLWFIVFVVLFWLIFYSLKPGFISRKDNDEIDTGKVLLAAILAALILIIIIWLIVCVCRR